MFKRGKKKKQGQTCDPQAATWAIITLITFPFIALCVNIAGIHPAIGFLAGAAGSIAVIAIEAVTRKRVWISEPCISKWLGHPSLIFRLVGFVAIVILLFQTFLLTGFLTGSSLDQNIVGYILNRQCAKSETGWFTPLCQKTEEPDATAVDPVASAMRDEAAKRFFPGSGLVSCSMKTIKQAREETTATRTALIRCDQWIIGRLVRTPVSVQSIMGVVASKLRVREDGSFEVESWSDDPSSASWHAIAGDLASPTMEFYRESYAAPMLHDLANENAVRIQKDLSRN